MLSYSHMDSTHKKVRTQLEIDFVANKGSQRYYIQSAFTIADEKKRQQEINPLIRVKKDFRFWEIWCTIISIGILIAVSGRYPGSTMSEEIWIRRSEI